MRQVCGEKLRRRLEAQTGLKIEFVMVRGGIDHRKDLCLPDGSIVYLWKDGTTTADGARWKFPGE